jgi:hypothetical protein
MSPNRVCEGYCLRGSYAAFVGPSIRRPLLGDVFISPDLYEVLRFAARPIARTVVIPAEPPGTGRPLVFNARPYLTLYQRVSPLSMERDRVRPASCQSRFMLVLHLMVDIVLVLIEHIAMTSSDLKTILIELELTQADFARLLGITPRAIALWIADERTIPGPAESYLRLFQLLPPNLRQVELNRLKRKGTAMRDGMFGITFQGQQGAGMGVLVFENGRVYGTDTEGVRYDGEYQFSESSGFADVKIKVTFPPNVMSVFGVANPYEWAFDVTAKFDPKQNSGTLAVMTSIGQEINARYVYLRSLPEAA